jgi:hypothetical protein
MEGGATPVFGIDGVQAVELALQYAAAKLSSIAPQVQWLEEPGHIGISRTIPDFLPAQSKKRIAAAIDRELQSAFRSRRK